MRWFLEPHVTILFLLVVCVSLVTDIGHAAGLNRAQSPRPPALTLSINSVTITEGNSGSINMIFNVSLSKPNRIKVAVNFSTADGTAKAGSDYLASSGRLTFMPGITLQTIPVPILGDRIDERDETFTVSLGTPVGATIAVGNGMGTIIDDDTPQVETSPIADPVPLPDGDSDGDGKIDLADRDTVTDTSPNPIRCYEFALSQYTRCETAQLNDSCDSDITIPAVGYIQDGVFREGSCFPLEAEDSAAKCSDGIDNNGNGLIDAADNDCFIGGFVALHPWRRAQRGFSAPVQFGRFEENCTDGHDNDGNGMYDCWDENCFYSESCPLINYSSCTDHNGNGVIERDFTDIPLAPLDSRRIATVCSQLYDVDNNASPDTEGRNFLQWMRDRHYAARVISIHARQMRDPQKRREGTIASFQKYFDLRNNPVYSQTTGFRDAGNFRIVFHEVRSTDDWMTNEPLAADVITGLEIYLRMVYFRNFRIETREEEVSYESQFDFEPCTEPPGTCLNFSRTRSWMSSTEDPTTFNYFYFAGRSTEPDRDFSRNIINTLHSQGFDRPPEQISEQYAHEMGHTFPLSHPLAFQGTLQNNLRYLLGTTSIMSAQGYVYTSIPLLAPLEAYALEPYAGFDNPDFGRIYSDALLTSTSP